MMPPREKDPGYDPLYAVFETPLGRRLREEAYGEDIGQHSWVTAEELRKDVARLRLSPSSRLLDLGCGPCGPLAFALGSLGCRATGIELSISALVVGRTRIASLGLADQTMLLEADLNDAIPLASGSFDAAMSLDAILHVRDRAALFREVARVLAPGGTFLFTDAGVVTGSISDEEVAKRSAHGYTQFVPPGFNERMLEGAGLHLVDAEDRTASVLRNATGRRAARMAHREELESLEGAAGFDRERRYLETVIELSRRGAVSRMAYLAESPAG